MQHKLSIKHTLYWTSNIPLTYLTSPWKHEQQRDVFRQWRYTPVRRVEERVSSQKNMSFHPSVCMWGEGGWWSLETALGIFITNENHFASERVTQYAGPGEQDYSYFPFKAGTLNCEKVFYNLTCSCKGNQWRLSILGKRKKRWPSTVARRFLRDK